MNPSKVSCTPFDSAHHKDTSLGDTFGGLGVCDEVCEEDARALRLARAERFPVHGTRSAADSPRTHDTYATWWQELRRLQRRARDLER